VALDCFAQAVARARYDVDGVVIARSAATKQSRAKGRVVEAIVMAASTAHLVSR
jgi:hypothetical protein